MAQRFIVYETADPALQLIVAYGAAEVLPAVPAGQAAVFVTESQFEPLQDALDGGAIWNGDISGPDSTFRAYWDPPFIGIGTTSGTGAIAIPVSIFRRADRNDLLAACDYTQLPDVPISATSKAAFATYRQALRDLPATDPGWPHDITWPVPPVYEKA